MKLDKIIERREAHRGSHASDYHNAMELPLSALQRIGSAMTSALATKVALTSTALDCMCFGVALVESDGKVLLANRAANAALEKQDGLALVGGRLTLTHGNNAHLARTLDESACSRALRVPKRTGGDYLMLVTPLAMHDELLLDRAHLVVIDDPANDPPDHTEVLGELFELTPAQARVAWHIACGDTTTEIAELLDVSITTVKTHLRELFAKTNTGRQADLARLFNRMLMLAN